MPFEFHFVEAGSLIFMTLCSLLELWANSVLPTSYLVIGELELQMRDITSNFHMLIYLREGVFVLFFIVLFLKQGLTV